jgi:gem associated protein 7
MNSKADTEKQKQRAILRERFLKMLKYMENKHIDIDTFKGAQVSGSFRSVDYDISNVHVNNLITPIGCVPEALVRTSDIVAIKFKTL